VNSVPVNNQEQVNLMRKKERKSISDNSNLPLSSSEVYTESYEYGNIEVVEYPSL